MNSNMKFESRLNLEAEKKTLMRLAAEFQQIKYTYQLKLSPPSFALMDSTSTLGLWEPEYRRIKISKKILTEWEWSHITEILKHEIAHQIADELLGGHQGHDQIFERACEMIFVEPWARYPTLEGTFRNPTLERLRKLSDPQQRENPFQKRIEKLLALSQSSNEHEAELALTKASELIDRHGFQKEENITLSDVYSHSFRTGKSRLDASYSYLAKIIGQHFGVIVLFAGEYDVSSGKEFRTMEFVGTAKDILIADYVAHYILNVTEKIWSSKKAEIGGSLRNRNSFRLGLMTGFAQKLETAKNKREQTSSANPLQKRARDRAHSLEVKNESSSLDLRQKLKEEFFARKFPKITNRSSSSRPLNQHAYHAGKQAGRALSVRPGVSGQNQILIPR